MAVERLATLAALWAAGFSAEALAAPGDPKLAKQLAAALEAGAPFCVVLAEDELERGEVQLKALAAHEAALVPRGELVAALERAGAARVRVGAGVERV